MSKSKAAPAPPKARFQYDCERVQVVKYDDGDTVQLNIDLGFHTWHADTFRFAGINCPELDTAAGQAAAAFTRQWFAAHAGLIRVETFKLEKWRRTLATFRADDDPRTLNRQLLDLGYATPMPGSKPE